MFLQLMLYITFLFIYIWYLETFKGKEKLGRKEKNKNWRERFKEKHRQQKNHRKSSQIEFT